MDFVVVDVETANADLSSICQVGIACFQGGRLFHSWKSLVDPEDYFDSINVSIHGIDEDLVQFSPTWAEVYSEVASLIEGRVVVSHTTFDYVAMRRACERANIQTCECKWLDSARVVRRAWSKFSRSGYGLANLALEFGITYHAHDALEDARCTGEILLLAISASGLTIDEWLVRANQPIHPFPSLRQRLDPNPNGPLYGEVLVFTGALSITRAEAAELAAMVGCQVDQDVTKHTTLLVVGDQDIRKLAGHQKSAKHIKAEDLIQKGHQVQVLSESDFKQLVAHGTAEAML